MNKERNYRIVRLLLYICGLILVFLSRNYADPARSILKYTGVGLVVAALITMILFRILPGSFKDKSPNPDEES